VFAWFRWKGSRWNRVAVIDRDTVEKSSQRPGIRYIDHQVHRRRTQCSANRARSSSAAYPVPRMRPGPKDATTGSGARRRVRLNTFWWRGLG